MQTDGFMIKYKNHFLKKLFLGKTHLTLLSNVISWNPAAVWRKSLKSEFLIYKKYNRRGCVMLGKSRNLLKYQPKRSSKEHLHHILKHFWVLFGLNFHFSSCFSFLLAFVFVLVVFLQFHCKWFYWFKLVNTFWQVDGNMCSLRKQVKKCSGYINNIIKAFVFSNWSVVESIRR